MARFTVVYDACVLYPAPLRDILMQLATEQLFRAKWTDLIHDEWLRNVVKDRPDLKPDQLTRTKELMNKAVADSLVTGFESLINGLTLPDLNDRHVLAAAIHARADAIVTFNLKDFPRAVLEPLGMEPIHPDDFIICQFDLNEPVVVAAATKCCRRLKSPVKTGNEYLNTLLAQRLPKTVAALRPYEQIIGA